MKERAYNSWLQDLTPFGLTKNEAIKDALKQQGKPIFDFTLGDPQEPTPSFIREALVKGLAAVSQYPQSVGSPGLRQACSRWLGDRFGVSCDWQKHVISSNGSKEAIFHIHHVLLNAASARRLVALPEPGYPVYRAGCVLAGGVPYEMPLKPQDQYVFNPDDIPLELCSRIAAVWLCYPHNPTGATISRSEIERIYAWALRHDIVILSDECYVDSYEEGTERPPSFLEVSQGQKFRNVVAFFSLSKRSGMTGYRSGFVAGDEHILAAFSKYRLNVGLGTPDFVQQAAIVAWGDKAHVIERNTIFAKKRQLVQQFCAANHLSILPSRAGLYVWGEAPKAYQTGREFTDALLRNTGMMLTPGDVFGPSCASCFRLALVPSVPDLETCLHIWQDAITKGTILC